MKRIIIVLTVIIVSTFANTLFASDVEIVCVNPDVSIFSAYEEYQFSFTSDDKDITSLTWSLSLPKVSGDVEIVELQDSAGFCKTPVLTNLDNYIISDGTLSATLDMTYMINGKQYKAEPFLIDFELKPKIFYAVIDSVIHSTSAQSYVAYYTVKFAGTDNLHVCVEEEYGSILRCKHIYGTNITSDKTDEIAAPYQAWIDFTAENDYGKTVYTIELLPNGVVSGVDSIDDNNDEYLEVYLLSGEKAGVFKSIKDIKSAGITDIVIIRRIIGAKIADVYKVRI